MENDEEKVYWIADSEIDKPYGSTTWYRSPGVENFVKSVEKEFKIVGVIFSDNNLGFVLDPKETR